MYRMGKRVETNAFHVFHPRFHVFHPRFHAFHPRFHVFHPRVHHGEAVEDRAELSRHFMFQVHKIGADLADRSLKLTGLDPTATDVDLELFDFRLDIVHMLLETFDITSQEAGIGAPLDDVQLELGDTRLQLLNVGPQQGHVEIDTARDGVVVFKLATDVFILAVAAVNVAILGQDGGMQVEDTGVELVDAVVDVQKGRIGHSRRRDVPLDGQPRAGHGSTGGH